eukprot:3594490-Rhodomonas_salina.6
MLVPGTAYGAFTPLIATRYWHSVQPTHCRHAFDANCLSSYATFVRACYAMSARRAARPRYPATPNTSSVPHHATFSTTLCGPQPLLSTAHCIANAIPGTVTACNRALHARYLTPTTASMLRCHNHAIHSPCDVRERLACAVRDRGWSRASGMVTWTAHLHDGEQDAEKLRAPRREERLRALPHFWTAQRVRRQDRASRSGWVAACAKSEPSGCAARMGEMLPRMKVPSSAPILTAVTSLTCCDVRTRDHTAGAHRDGGTSNLCRIVICRSSTHRLPSLISGSTTRNVSTGHDVAGMAMA